MSTLRIADRDFSSRLFLGTGKFAHSASMVEAVKASGSELVTLSMRRVDQAQQSDGILQPLNELGVNLLPNTSGARNAKEAILAGQLCREAMGTSWLKLEIHPDPRYLMPDPVETLAAADELVRQGFIVLPYVHADPVLCKRLEAVGCAAVMPLGSVIGSNQGLQTQRFLQIIIEQSSVPVVVDAGLGAPSHACEAMEMGADAVLVNTAIAVANSPIRMAKAFAQGVNAGRMAYEAGLAGIRSEAEASSPMTDFISSLN